MVAKNILIEWLSQTDQTDFKEGHYFVIEEAMKEYARIKCEELLLLVAEKAKSKEINYEDGMEWVYYIKVDKNSILNAIDLEKFCS